jgi:NAD(P)H-hydrate epimerase
MEALRQTQGCTVAAVDLPSGVDPDTGEIFPGAVIADRTFLIGEAKRGLLSGGAANATGSLSLVHVEELSGEAGDREMICPQRMHFGKAPRAFDFHKGNAGRLGILAGSPEFTGAALIAATGALRAGGGLITLYSPKATCDAILARLPFEVMFKPCDDPRDLLLERLDALVVGPGLGDMSGKFSDGLLELISSTEVPMVIDADALNLIARNPVEMDERHVLTPHPGEFGRLAPGLDGMSREDAARKFVSTNGATLLLKGARTIVARRNEPLRFNSTGTPAMANGGQGDLLSGVIGAMLAQGMRHIDAASFGAWLCGHAAEIFTAENGSPSTAHDVSGRLGLAARAWRERSR